ncbi:unnamed protein product [Adineta steineri]|nr:unnamed protein product [Adineta steineri]CAF1646267.1 unnamed protein product [Adineta steineri]
MIELPDLFHENRIPELTLSLILYIPIGLCLVLIRSVILLLLFVISSIFPKNSSLNQLLNEVISLILTFSYENQTVGNEEKDNRRAAKILVANRVSLFDEIVIQRFICNTNCKVV